ncbi:MAG: hypothetical protein ACKVQU_01525 [Burkholderiales bacterium]
MMHAEELQSMSASKLAALLAETDASILAVVVYHFTGDDAILDAVRPHIAGGWDDMQSVPDDVQAARFDEANGRWMLTIQEQGKQPEQFEAAVLLACIGPLNRPYTPPIPGLDSFAGPRIHTGAWDAGIPLEGRRVGMIGAGASAYQTGPTIAGKVGHLVVFQRSAHWSVYNRRVDARHSQLVWSHPGVTSWYRNAKGRVFATTPWRMVDYWNFTRHFRESDFSWTA